MPRTLKRSRTQRAVTVVHFAKRGARRNTRASDSEDTQSTAVTSPGEVTRGGDDQDERKAPVAEAEEEGPREYLVRVPPDSGGHYRADRVARLLKGQQPGHPFPPLSDDDVTELACFGRFLFEVTRYDDAQLVLEGLVASGVMDAFPYSMLGTVYLAQRDLNRALALFEAALALSPEDLASHVYRAEIRLRQGRPELAGADLRYALEHGDPDDPFTLRALQLKRLVKKQRRG